MKSIIKKIIVGLKKNDKVIVVLLLALMFGQSFLAMAGDEAWGGHNPGDTLVIDELAHIPAGYAQLRYGDYRLNQEHPPLLKDLSALPLLFVSDLKFPLDSAGWQTEPNGQWEVGRKFIYELGNNTNLLIWIKKITKTDGGFASGISFQPNLARRDSASKRLKPVFFLTPNFFKVAVRRR